MIHGFRGTHHGLLLIGNLLKKDYNVVIPDLPGFGRGAKLPEYSLENYVKWLSIYIKRRNLTKPPILLGHSFGSIICAAYAAEFPKTISKLILVNPIGAPALEGPQKFMTKLAVLYYKIGAKLPEKAAHKWLAAKPIVRVMSMVMAKTHNKTQRVFIHQQHDKYFSLFHSPKSLLESFKTSISHNVAEFADQIKTPTLLVAGAIDDITPLSKQYALRQKIKGSKLKVIKDVGHLTHYETPDQVADAVKRFLLLPSGKSARTASK